MQVGENFLGGFGFTNNFANIFDKSPKTISKVEQAIQPLVSKYGATDSNDFSNVTKATLTAMDKLQDSVIEDDETLDAFDFIEATEEGLFDVDDSLNSMESLLAGVTDEEDLAGIQAELSGMIDEINKIAENAFGEIDEIVATSEGISAVEGSSNGRGNTFSVSIGDKEVKIDIMDFSAEGLGLNAIDLTKDGGFDEAVDIINQAKMKIEDGLSYLSGVKDEIVNTFNQYKDEVISDIMGQIGDTTSIEAQDLLKQLQAIVVENADEAVIAQMNREPEAVLALID